MEPPGDRDSDIGSSGSGSGDIVTADEKLGFYISGHERMVAMSTNNRDSAASVNYQQQPQYQAPPPPRRLHARMAQKLERWLFLYNVTTGLYMLDWWERCIFNSVFLVFFAVAGYNSGHYLQRIGAGLLSWAWCGGSERSQEAFLPGGAGVDELGFG